MKRIKVKLISLFETRWGKRVIDQIFRIGKFKV